MAGIAGHRPPMPKQAQATEEWVLVSGAEAVQGRGDDGSESLASPSPSISSRQAPKSRSAKKRERQKAKKKASQLHVSDAVSAQVEGAEVVASEVVVANSSGPESDGCQQVVVFDGYADDEDAAKAGEAGGGVGGSRPVSANLLATWKDMSDSFMKGVSEISAKAKQSVNQMDSGRLGDNYPQRQDQGQGEVRTRGSVGHPAEDSSCVTGEEQGGLPRPSSLAATLGSLLTHNAGADSQNGESLVEFWQTRLRDSRDSLNSLAAPYLFASVDGTDACEHDVHAQEESETSALVTSHNPTQARSGQDLEDSAEISVREGSRASDISRMQAQEQRRDDKGPDLSASSLRHLPSDGRALSSALSRPLPEQPDSATHSLPQVLAADARGGGAGVVTDLHCAGLPRHEVSEQKSQEEELVIELPYYQAFTQSQTEYARSHTRVAQGEGERCAGNIQDDSIPRSHAVAASLTVSSTGPPETRDHAPVSSDVTPAADHVSDTVERAQACRQEELAAKTRAEPEPNTMSRSTASPETIKMMADACSDHVRESPHAKLAFLDVVKAGALGSATDTIDELTFFETLWTNHGILHGSDTLAVLPDARLFGSSTVTPQQPTASGMRLRLGCGGGTVAAAAKSQLVVSVSKALVEMGPRPLQQDVVHVGGVRGNVPVVIVCDGHGYVNLLNTPPADAPLEWRNSLHVGGRQAAEISCQTLAQYLDKYAEELSVHAADRFFHRAFCLAHQVVLKQIRMGALPEAQEGGLARYLHAPANTPGSALDAAYFRQAVSKWAALVPKAVASSGVLSKHLRTVAVSGQRGEGSADAASDMVGDKCVDGVYYKRANGAWEHLDFGTTATCCLVCNAPDAAKPHRKLCLTAHVGDSDACLFRFSQSTPQSRPVLQMATWLTKEHTMYAEDERLRPVPRGGLLQDYEGEGALRWKARVDVAMPEGLPKAVAYEPTRGLGHIFGQHYGISPCPSVSVCEVAPLDVIVVGSDGIWNPLGGRRAPGCLDARLPEQVEPSQPLYTRMRDFFLLHHHKEPPAIAAELMALTKKLGLQDNTSLAVIKITSTGAAAVGKPP